MAAFSSTKNQLARMLKTPALTDYVASIAQRGFVTKSLPLQNASLVSTEQFGREEIEDIISMSQYMHGIRNSSSENVPALLAGRTLGTMFYEQSTVTSSSFAAAIQLLGGKIIELDVERDEPLEDSVRTMNEYADCIVMRHPTSGALVRAASVSKVPVINAGEADNEHPTQALGDLFTIISELKLETPDNLNVTLVGNLAGERAAQSLTKLLSQFSGVTFNFVAPDALQMPASAAAGTSFTTLSTYADVLATTDVLYFTQMPRELFASTEEYDAYTAEYRLEASHMAEAKDNMVVMHPLPRVNEIATEVDDDDRAAYFRQAGYGLSTRMALLTLTTGTAEQVANAKVRRAEYQPILRDAQPLGKRGARPAESTVPNTMAFENADATSKSGSRKNLSSRPMQGKSAHSL